MQKPILAFLTGALIAISTATIPLVQADSRDYRRDNDRDYKQDRHSDKRRDNDRSYKQNRRPDKRGDYDRNYKRDYRTDKRYDYRKPKKSHPIMTLDPDNGIIFCETCHYGKGHQEECSTGKLATLICKDRNK